MADKTEVDLIVKAITEGFDKVGADLKKAGSDVESAGKQISKSSMFFTELNSQINVAKQAFSTFAEVFKKTFELGAEGAAVNQTRESFDMLLDSIGAAPDTLARLRAASKGTVSDMTLMSSTATLLAGVSGDLAKSLADTAPEILEIAKAANKLNPSLGTTEFLYNSLMTGIKRGSPLLIDNTGLTLKIGEANAKYAAQLGKTVEQLSDGEKKQALLNATLEAGATLMEQVGGNTDSATDSIARMDTAVKNAADAFKAQLAPAIGDAADAITIMLSGGQKLIDMTNQHSKEVASITGSYDDYVKEMRRVVEAQGVVIKQNQDGTIEVFKAVGSGLVAVTDQYNILTRSQYEAGREGEEMAKRFLGQVVPATDQASASVSTFKYSLDEVASFVRGEVGKVFDDYDASMAGLKKTHDELTAQMQKTIEEGYSPTSEKVMNLSAKIDENELQQRELKTSLDESTAALLYQQLAAHADAETAFDLAVKFGLVDDETKLLHDSMEVLTEKYDKNKDGAIDAAEATAQYWADVQRLKDNVDKLHDKTITITTIFEEVRRVSNSEASQNFHWNDGSAYATGTNGWQIVPPGFENDTYPIRLSSGEAFNVVPRSEVGRASSGSSSGGGQVNNFYGPVTLQVSDGTSDEISNRVMV